MAGTVTTGAILFTDMVGSTELRSRLGDTRADELRRHHDDLLARAVADHGGEVLRWTGDGIKAAFSSASDAVAAAVAVQRAVVTHNADPAAVAPFQVRIGLAAGEITVDAGDHHGMAVIEAARLEAIARPGEILATDVVRVLGQRRAQVVFEEVGERTLKGLDRPVVVHRVIDAATVAAPSLPRVLSSDRRFPLVGRDEELRTLVSSWEQARIGSPRFAFVRGPAGAGKSRLTAQLAEHVHGDGGLVLAGSCDSDLEVPYQPFADALRDVVELDGLLADAVASRSGTLARLFPGSTSSAAEAQPAAARLELFEAVGSLVERIAAQRPVLLVLDDLHWAAAPTVLLLRHLVQHAGTGRLLVVGTHRDEDLAAGHPLRDLLADTRASASTTRLTLEMLGEDGVADLVAAAMPGASRAQVGAVARVVHRDSAGNAFFACELLQHLATTGQLEAVADASVDQLPIPDSLHDVVAQRLARLGSGADEVLRSAAVIGPSFDLEVLARVLDRSPDDVLDVLDEACRATLVVEVGIDQFAFAHAIVRGVLLSELSATRRARAHRRVAEAIEKGGLDQFDELALHWRAGGDEARAIGYVARAARRDLVALAYESARSRYEQVLEVLARDVSASASARAEAWLGYGTAVRALGDPSYIDSVIKAARLARSTRDVEVLGEAATLSIWPGTFYFNAGLPDDDVIEVCESALAVLDANDPTQARVRVRVLANLASHLTFVDRDRRVAIIAEATELAARLGDPALVGVVLNAEFLCMWEPRTHERRVQIGRELTRIARAIGDAEFAFLGRFFTAFCLAEAAEVDESVAMHDELMRLAAESRNFYFAFLAERLPISIDVARCRPDVAADIDRLATTYAGTYADTDGTWALHTGARALQAGTLGSMVGALQAVGASSIPGAWKQALGLAQLWAGDLEGATYALDVVDPLPPNYFWMAVTQVRAELAVGLGRPDRCASLLDELVPYRGRLGITASGSLVYGLVSRTIGMLALSLGRLDVAEDHLREAVAQADALRLPFDGVVARRLLADAVEATDASDAATLRTQALEAALAHGFAREAELLGAPRHSG
jgi:class 3 adenylate cyclase/tetratricopeptide (TPR) repeat protein